MLSAALALAAASPQSSAAPAPILPRAAATANAPIEEVLLSPLYGASFMCSEHWEGQLRSIGDALGQDCMVIGGIDESADEGGFPRLYRTNGKDNADWYGWREELLAPFDGVVKRIVVNSVVNQPGTLGKPPASFIIFERADGTDVLYAHVADVRVKVGDRVNAGQVVAVVGNNGMARAPHTHIGAWRGSTPLQIRWDLRAMAKLIGGAAAEKAN